MPDKRTTLLWTTPYFETRSTMRPEASMGRSFIWRMVKPTLRGMNMSPAQLVIVERALAVSDSISSTVADLSQLFFRRSLSSCPGSWKSRSVSM